MRLKTARHWKGRDEDPRGTAEMAENEDGSRDGEQVLLPRREPNGRHLEREDADER